LRYRSGVIKPIIVVQLLVVMMLAGVGTAFAVGPNAVSPTATPAAGSLAITNYVEVYSSDLTQVIGITVTVHNKDDVPHSGTVNVSIEQEGDFITGQGSIVDLAGGSTIDITINMEPMSIGNYQWRVIVRQTS
jgi:hypothetical protein